MIPSFVAISIALTSLAYRDASPDTAPAVSAFEYHGFQTACMLSDESGFRSISPPAWSAEELQRFAAGENVPPPGSVFEGVLWYSGAEFASQWTDYMQLSHPTTWTREQNGGYQVPVAGTNFCGSTERIGWSGTTFGSIRVYDRANPRFSRIAPSVERVRLMLELSISPESYFDRLVSKHGGAYRRHDDSGLMSLEWQSEDRQRTARYAVRDTAEPPGFEWQFCSRIEYDGTTHALQFRIIPIDATGLWLPRRPSALPACVTVDVDPTEVVFVNATSDHDWDPDLSVVGADTLDGPASGIQSIRRAFAFVAILVGAAIALALRRSSRYPQTKGELR